jgi:tRNA nucleotidyltransferase (CCA-adding enzyme)
VERGPRFRELLDAVLSAKLNGRVISREDEVAMVQELLN